jgi:drug/metabolite transporter (DMT)-like permease
MIHLFAVLIVIIGIAFINYSKWIDGNERDEEGVEKAMVSGSILALIAAFCYALSNVLQEKISLEETGYPWSTLSAMGIGGSVLSLIVTQFTHYGM